MNEKFTARKICRAGVIAALYVALSYLVQPLSFGVVQFRLSEALATLPLFYAESVPALFVGCALANLGGTGAFDVLIGSLATLVSAACSYAVGRAVKNKSARFFLGMIFPVVINAFAIPLVFLLSGVESYGYWIEVLLVGGGQLEAIGVFGSILYFSLYKFVCGSNGILSDRTE